MHDTKIICNSCSIPLSLNVLTQCIHTSPRRIKSTEGGGRTSNDGDIEQILYINEINTMEIPVIKVILLEYVEYCVCDVLTHCHIRHIKLGPALTTIDLNLV